MRRSLDSEPNLMSLRSAVSTNNRILNFDQMQVSGSLGDTIQSDGVRLERRRISIVDENGVEVGRVGRLDD